MARNKNFSKKLAESTREDLTSETESQQPTRNSNQTRADGAIICRCSPNRIHELVGRSSKEQIARITSLGFGGTTKVGIKQLPTELRRWVLDIYDVSSQTFKVGPEMTLKINEEDVYNVYKLPRGAKKIELEKTTRHAMDSMVRACALKYAKATKKERVELKDLKVRLDHENDLEKWCQMYVLYLTSTLICTTPYQHANMKYADILRRNCLVNLVDYNWCGHVLKHMHEGFVEAQTKKYLNVDLHLIMVCICEKFGSRANRPKPIIPLCGEWETTDARKEWKAIEAKGSNFISVGNKIKFLEFGPETKVNLEGLTYAELVRLEQWILSIKVNCEANLSALREHVRAKQANSAHPRETSIPNVESINRDMEEVVDEGTSMVVYESVNQPSALKQVSYTTKP